MADIAFEPAIPILRIFDEGKARAWYVDFLGLAIDWEHRFGADFPLYMQASRGGLTLHLSEHHGDSTPGSTAHVRMRGLDAFHAELSLRGGRAAIEDGPDGLRVLQLWDPFGNRLRFAEPAPPAPKLG
jgi:catechol 2,3-dioxygenase-like lactoylglutathione lyase family enzyme